MCIQTYTVNRSKFYLHFLQVKSISREARVNTGGSAPVPPGTVQKKLTNAEDQLEKDAQIITKVMEKSVHWQSQGQGNNIKQVIAVPNLTRNDLAELEIVDKVRKVCGLILCVIFECFPINMPTSKDLRSGRQTIILIQ